IGVASSEAPFHVQLSAVEAKPPMLGATAPSPGSGSISLTATFPPAATLYGPLSQVPRIWLLQNDLDLTAIGIPTALACDYVGLDPAWAESLGDTLETVQITAHSTASQDGSRISF